MTSASSSSAATSTAGRPMSGSRQVPLRLLERQPDCRERHPSRRDTPPDGMGRGGALPQTAASLTPEENAMWDAQMVNITARNNETLGAFLRGFGEDTSQDMYVLTNDVGGPDNATSTGKLWKIVPPPPSLRPPRRR
ncbi:hypothetical protein [Methanoculleus chikugoensis]|uniref:hypothetical protein n=1 Tax=Methanoculleus chikugoensis TaxID=118126 RepID=UPI000A989D68|nr:hypothetical protein [Methanoculleus chikugoensis]